MHYKLYLNFYRNVTKEEIDFAEIADKCPWLENKIIDFSYFYNQNIINRQEYQELMSLISNDLRIANGKLLLYSNEYKNALKSKIEDVSTPKRRVLTRKIRHRLKVWEGG